MFSRFKLFLLNNDLIKYSLTTFFIKICGLLLSFAFMHYIISNFNLSLWGEYVLFEKSLLIISMLSSLGLSTATVKLASKYYNQGKIDKIRNLYFSIFILIIIFCTLLLLFFIYLVPRIDIIYNNDFLNVISFNSDTSVKGNHAIVFYYLCISVIPCTLLLIHSDFLRSIGHHKFFSIINKNNFVLPVVFLIVIFFNERPLTLDYFLSLYLYVLIFFFIISFFFLIAKLRLFKYDTIKISYSSCISLLKLSIPMVFASFALTLLQWVDIICLSFYSDFEVVGENGLGKYAVVVKYASVTTLILYSINSITSTKLSKYFHLNNIPKFKSTILNSCKIIFYSTMPIIILLLIFSFYIDCFDSEFDNKVKIAFRILILSNLINSICGPVGQILLMTGKEKIFQTIVFLAVVINIFLNIFLIPIYGIVGAALSTLISVAFWNLVSVYFVYKYHKVLTIYMPWKNNDL